VVVTPSEQEGQSCHRPQGIVTASDLRQFQALGVDLASTSVAQVMSTPVFTLPEDATLWDAHQLMLRHRIRHVVITGAQGEVRGLVTQDRILSHLDPLDLVWQIHALEQSASEQEALQPEAHPEAQPEAQPEAHQTEKSQQPLSPSLDSPVTPQMAALQASEERWYLALQASQVGIWDWDFESNQVFRCQRWMDLRGYSADQRITTLEEWQAGIHPEDRDRVLASFNHHIQQKTPHFQEEYRVQRQDGTYVWILDRGQGLWDETGRITRMVGAEMDITPRKRAELALREREALYRAVMDGASDAILLADLKGHLIQGNHRAEILLGYPQEAIAQLSIGDIYPVEGLAPPRTTFADGMGQGQGQLLNGWLRRGDGRLVAVDVTCSLITVGQQQLQMGIFRDISDRKQIEDQLRKTAVHLNTAQRIANMGSWEFDIATETLIWSQEIFRIFGRDPDQGPPSYSGFTALIHPEDRDRHHQALRHASTTGLPHEIDLRIWRADGKLCHISIRGEAILDDRGNPCRLVGTLLDVTERREWEAALQKSEAQYRAIVEDQTELICRFLPNGQFTFANKAYCRYFAIDPDHYRGANLWDFVCKENTSLVRQKVQSLTPENPMTTYEERDPFPDGGFRWQIWTDRAIFDAQGKVVEYQSVGHDITERKLAELALQESEEKLRLFLEYAPAAVAMLDNQLCYLAVSNRWRQDYDLGDRPLIGQSHYDIFPNIPPHWQEAHRRCLAGSKETREAYPYRRANGQVDWVHWEARPWRRRNGSIGGIVIMTEMITEQREAQEQLKKLSDRLTLAIQAGAIGIWEWDILEDLVIWDDRMYELYGIHRSTFLGTYQAWYQRVHPDDRDKVEAFVAQALADEPEFTHEFRVVWPDGQIRYLRASALIQRNSSGQAERMVGINFDVTKRRLAEQQLRQTNEQLELTNQELERATRLKDEFLANMSHELRTPLNAILGMSEGLQEEIFGSLTEPQRQAIATIERSGSHLLELITDILDLSKIEAGKLELELGPVSINNLCNISVTFVRQAAHQKNIRITTQLAPEITWVQADDRRLRQVLINLLTNAVKFTPEGGEVCLETTLEPAVPLSSPVPASPTSAWIAFRVRDTGIGIAPEDMHKLFQPFVQIDSSLNRQQSGTGLGLSLVQRIIDLHEGSISVESEVGRGSCFTVRLPFIHTSTMERETLQRYGMQSNCWATNRCRDDQLPPTTNENDPERSENRPVATAQPEPPAASSDSLLPSAVPLILIADDNPANISTISSYLQHRGYRLILARNGQEALDLAQNQIPDLILMDIQMPEMNGLEATRRLRAEGHSHIPIIALTALAMPGDRERCLAAGANDYLSKPIQLKHLAEKIAQLLPTQT